MKQEIYKFIEVENCNFCKNSKFKKLGIRLNKSHGFRPRKKTGISVSIMKCKECGLVFSNPLTIPNNIQDNYNISPEQYWNKEYFSVDDNYFQNVISTLKNKMGIKDKVKVLDIGAGIGKCMIALEKSGFAVYGIEPSTSFRKMAIEKMGVNPEYLKQAAIEDADFEPEFFDFITFGAVLEHLYRPAEAIDTALKWLKPNGVIHIEVPNSRWLSSRIVNFINRIRGSEYVVNLSPMHPPFHLFEFSLKTFRRLSKINNEYELVYHEYYVCETYLPKIFDFILKPIMKKTNTGMQLEIWLRKK